MDPGARRRRHASAALLGCRRLARRMLRDRPRRRVFATGRPLAPVPRSWSRRT